MNRPGRDESVQPGGPDRAGASAPEPALAASAPSAATSERVHPQPDDPLPRWGRLRDRTLWILLGVALLALLLAIGFAFWINGSGALHPVPVSSRPSG